MQAVDDNGNRGESVPHCQNLLDLPRTSVQRRVTGGGQIKIGDRLIGLLQPPIPPMRRGSGKWDARDQSEVAAVDESHGRKNQIKSTGGKVGSRGWPALRNGWRATWLARTRQPTRRGRGEGGKRGRAERGILYFVRPAARRADKWTGCCRGQLLAGPAARECSVSA